MAEEAGFILGEISHILSEMLLLVKDDLNDLRITVSAVIVMLPDAEERSATSNFTAWLEKLKDALYDTDDLPDELSFDVLRRLLFPWSRENNYVYLSKMSSQIQVIKNRLTSPERVFDMLNFFDHLLVKIPLMAAKSTTLVAGCPTRMKTTEKIHETYPNKKMGYGVAELEHQSMSNGSKKRNLNFVSDDLLRQERKGIREPRELRDRLESLTKNEEEFIKSSVPEVVEIYDDPTKRGINNAKVTATDDLTREGVQSKFRDLENQLYDNGNDKVECKDFPGLEQALKNTVWGEIPEYLESIAIQIEKDRGKTTDVFHIAIQVLVCAAIKEMKDFSVGDLDWDTLKKWGATLNYAEKFGFQVRFADNLLKKNLLAYFAVQNLPKSTAKK
ncbi:hypothetical protein E1A91_A11G361700v1 [Gossypium mustelinum]|uniref:Disease resistance N-terminal domain-containing protein n=3 Tax=Gossypium TaxID=3633 RepID=A0A5J5TYC7_GOSBA|nr:hypothetical protein ES319_A11G352200v1 [Gossypium barbadense]TYG96850.1 hypothetical protein ES288_A11G386000v1 [Gossypium darwinii]TYG96851.1 hypothetical protein ES288_A11G386000v1 [Gossypium darwinii]TYJ12584.1 hypothetical protein E1A91_A11G361700v1 [Gossypium mustelinum]